MSLTRWLTALALACGLLLTTLPVPATAGNAEYGRTWRKDGVLRADCHHYRFRYVIRPGKVKPPGNDWALELFVLDKHGRGVASLAKDSAFDAKRGKPRFKLCGSTTAPGRFKIRGKLSVYEGSSLVDEVWIKPGFFRLRKP